MMTRQRYMTAFLVGILSILVLTLPHSAQALVVQGIGAIDEDNLARAEQLALDDAFGKAILQSALTAVPGSAIPALLDILPDYRKNRGNQDITQYKITSRLRQQEQLHLTVDMQLDDTALREWLAARTLTTSRALRPRTLLMISAIGPEEEAIHEWWHKPQKPAYAPFEKRLAASLRNLGENIIVSPQVPAALRYAAPDQFAFAEANEADLLISGSVSYIPLMENLYECSVQLTLYDVTTRESLQTWNLAQRGDLKPGDMNDLLAGQVLPGARARIAGRILNASPVLTTRNLVIADIADYGTYQGMVNTLSAMEQVESLTITGMKDHRISHTLRLKGSLEDVLTNLKSHQLADIAVEMKGDEAVVRILRH